MVTAALVQMDGDCETTCTVLVHMPCTMYWLLASMRRLSSHIDQPCTNHVATNVSIIGSTIHLPAAFWVSDSHGLSRVHSQHFTCFALHPLPNYRSLAPPASSSNRTQVSPLCMLALVAS